MAGIGCTDNGCIFGSTGGMGTIGGCRCVMRHALSPIECNELKTKIRAQTTLVETQGKMLEEQDKSVKKQRKLLFEAHRLVCSLLSEKVISDSDLAVKVDAWLQKVNTGT